MAATIPGSSMLGLPSDAKQKFKRVLGLLPEKNEKELYAIFQADTLSRFYVPAVMMGHDSPPPPSNRIVHILGRDAKSMFMSHALHGIYDSVKTINLRGTSYRNVTGSLGKKRRDGVWIEENQSLESATQPEKDDGHISNLVVGGRSSQVIKLLENVKHRVDDRTAICYMQDGLGVAEAVNNELFTDVEKQPSIVLAHMHGSLAFERESHSVRSLRRGAETVLTAVRPSFSNNRDKHLAKDTRLRTQAMLEMFANSSVLNARGAQLESWMRYKIHSLIFQAVVDPICVLLDARYDQILYNGVANKLVDQLLKEISEVVEGMPELRQSNLHLELCGEHIRKRIMGKIRGKNDAPSKMVWQIQNGQVTDIDYLNGFFIERGRRLKLSLPANEMVVNMVKAKHRSAVEKIRSYVPLELTSRRD